jgi:hypothetical protein
LIPKLFFYDSWAVGFWKTTSMTPTGWRDLLEQRKSSSGAAAAVGDQTRYGPEHHEAGPICRYQPELDENVVRTNRPVCIATNEFPF